MKTNISVDYCDKTYGGLFFIKIGELDTTLPFAVDCDLHKSIDHLQGFFYVNGLTIDNKYSLIELNGITSVIFTREIRKGEKI